ncbi:Glycerol kinase [Dissostichus eleginoides]|uniref:Glycerol kinase n=1 Tax=Dissostichus eleginoides TaxID=100907 RepID=A0AAD9FG52_DISEL|nr:Glycerol kinase [Dissostichus eleginoides]
MGREHDPKHRPDTARLQRHTLLSASLSSRKHKPGPPGAAERTHTALRENDAGGSWNPPEASSEGGGPHLDPELEGGFADLTAFLSAEEIHRSLDLALEAFGGTFEDPESSKTAENPQTKASSPCEGEGAASEAPPLIKHTSIEVEKPTPVSNPCPPSINRISPASFMKVWS